jgi:hypothetical protein
MASNCHKPHKFHYQLQINLEMNGIDIHLKINSMND